jgi:hypothetical protein
MSTSQRGNILSMVESTTYSIPTTSKSKIQNLYGNTSSSHVGDEGNDIKVGMDDFLWDSQATKRMLLHAFQQNELGDGVDILDTFFESLKSTYTSPLFGHESRSNQLGTTMLLFNLKAMYDMSDACFSALLK